jgi:hypothetical protein
MPTKKTHETLASALAAAQGEMSNASKNAKNPHFKSTYADLASMRDAVIPVLSAHGIALIQLCDGDGQTVSVTTRILFGAESMDCGRLTIPIGGARNPAQAVGGAITYARRYQLGAVAGVAATEDDDGNSLDGTRAAPPRRPAPSRMDHAGKARAILSKEIGCGSAEDAEAAIRYSTSGKLGAVDLDTEGEEIFAALESLRETCGGDWTGYLKSAVSAWKAQA